jgi:hypothetical protein
MKNTPSLARRSKLRAKATNRRRGPATVLGSIPGLERLLPGHYRPSGTVRTRYGTWTLPRRFRSQALRAIIDGCMIG